MNTVTITYIDKPNRSAGILLNNQHVGVGTFDKVMADGFNYKQWFTVRLCNIHNQSNPIEFKAATMETLIKKIAKHNFQLVKY